MEAIKKGIAAALTTPFVGEAVSLDRLRRNIERSNRSGLAGYVVLGSTGRTIIAGARSGVCFWAWGWLEIRN